MPIKVLFFAELKEITNKYAESFNLSNSSIKELVELLFNKYATLKNVIWDSASDNLKNTVSIAINDSLITNEDKLSILLSNDDKIAFLLPISGG
ncbi:MAG: MoaD/ThiS family protein [Promethearchaeota archaeon]